MTYLIHREMSPRVLARYWRMYSPQGRAMRPIRDDDGAGEVGVDPGTWGAQKATPAPGESCPRRIILVGDDGTETAIEGAPRSRP